MTNPADVFCLLDSNGHLLPPAVQATVLAKYSRSPDSARQILKNVTEDLADKFYEKWVTGFGHNSVADLAVIPVCFENVSIVASKFIEQWQRPGYSEKSTRYQEFSSSSFITPPGAPASMKSFATKLYEAYEKLGDPVRERCASLMNLPVEDRLVRARAFDSIRYLLPAGTGTNVAVVANVRDFRDMICDLRGHRNLEFQEIGNKLHNSVVDVCPALVRHTEPNQFIQYVSSLGNLSNKFNREKPSWYVDIHKPFLMCDPELEQVSFESTVADNHGMSWEAFSVMMHDRPAHKEVPKIFKNLNISFDIMMDYGAYRDLQRHRRCEQWAEPLTPNYGYLIPDDIAGSDIESDYTKAMELVHDYNDNEVVYNTELMQYITPLGYLHRSKFRMDLKELYYIVELRTKPQGHISYRRVAYEMYNLAKARWPKLLQWCRAIRPDEIGLHT